MQITKSKKFMIFLTVFVMSLTILTGSLADIFKTSAAATYKVEKLYSPAGYGQKSDTQISSSGKIIGGNNWSILVNSGNLLYCLEAGKAVKSENYVEKSFVTNEKAVLLSRIYLCHQRFVRR